ncbi:uncharacterized protein GGS25DRAFT_329322 [Hypoxylon fragiforme]|uniref:uncharacterized protein n=1 Tax=Hypoxylon fragiforme TaxID=63214 RepID=UPI0020C6EB1F|nr:uncharacterized protein GGS25DRAFT_329322 [Hypoxylon fragiforme]KAI2607335.1 hypothetical protein GGS25DRAFT_329322 [Hypoxylon fragiforme]
MARISIFRLFSIGSHTIISAVPTCFSIPRYAAFERSWKYTTYLSLQSALGPISINRNKNLRPLVDWINVNRERSTTGATREPTSLHSTRGRIRKETRHKSLPLDQELGMNFYLPPYSAIYGTPM